MFKIKKEKPSTMNPAQMVGSMEQFADAAREHWTWLIAGVAVADFEIDHLALSAVDQVMSIARAGLEPRAHARMQRGPRLCRAPE